MKNMLDLLHNEGTVKRKVVGSTEYGRSVHDYATFS
jgi:hypothetical protein